MSAQLGSYDTIIVGTSFASSFFLHRYLRSAKPSERILVLERGRLNPHSSQIDNRKSFLVDPLAMGGPSKLAPLGAVLASTDVRVVFHAAEYDIFILHTDAIDFSK